jgi:general secretion pathway protein K
MNSRPSKIFSKPRRCKKSHESGIALIAVLWVLLLLSALAATVGYVARTNAILTHRAADIAQAQAAADAAIIHTISDLSDEQVSRHPATSGNEQSWEFQGFKIGISVSKEPGRIDVNTVNKELISAFLQSQGLNQETATTLTGDLRDRVGSEERTVGHRATSESGELGQVAVQGMGPLRAVEELRQIPSWRVQNMNCWMDSLTVYTGLPAVSVADASTAVISALKWAQEHHMGDHEWITAAPAPSVANAQTSVIGDVLRISATANGAKNIRATTVWVGRLTGDLRSPILTMRWDHATSEVHGNCVHDGR